MSNLASDNASFTRPAKILHWLMGALIIATFALGSIMTDMSMSPTKLKYFSYHKWMGVTVLLLAALRLLWRLGHAAPPYPASMPQWQQQAAHGLHGLLYLLFFAVPLSGYFYSLAAGFPIVYFGIIPLPVFIAPNPELKPILKEVHSWLTVVLACGVGLHLAAALKHHFIDHDATMKRMLP
jgi:cytochrome b561